MLRPVGYGQTASEVSYSYLLRAVSFMLHERFYLDSFFLRKAVVVLAFLGAYRQARGPRGVCVLIRVSGLRSPFPRRGSWLVEPRRFELLTSAVQRRRSPN
jgi:hypothetical protein